MVATSGSRCQAITGDQVHQTRCCCLASTPQCLLFSIIPHASPSSSHAAAPIFTSYHSSSCCPTTTYLCPAGTIAGANNVRFCTGRAGLHLLTYSVTNPTPYICFVHSFRIKLRGFDGEIGTFCRRVIKCTQTMSGLVFCTHRAQTLGRSKSNLFSGGTTACTSVR